MSRSSATTPKKGRYHHGDLKNALIAAGADVLSKEGVGALSLRRVAQRAGVSHAAPYAHFADKQALIAEISTAGYRRLYEAIRRAKDRHEGDPETQLVEAAWAYVKFALDDTDLFKVTMSGVVEREQDHAAYVEMSQKSFALLLEMVRAGQLCGVLRPGPTDVVAVSVWSLVHGFASLLLERQIPGSVRAHFSARRMLIATLNQMTDVELCAR